MLEKARSSLPSSQTRSMLDGDFGDHLVACLSLIQL